jgi:hypothetical protein
VPTIEVQVRRLSLVSSRPFGEIVERLTATIGRPDMKAFHRAVAAATTAAEVQEAVHAAIGSSGLMEFARMTPVKCCERTATDEGPTSSASSLGIRSS